MSSSCRNGLAAAALAALAAAAPDGAAETPATKTSLTVCADPANLPYSDEKQEGFENRIATLLADDLGAELRYFWFAEHRSFFRRTLLDGQCDLVVSVPSGLSMVATTQPYFASSYVAVTRAKDGRRFTSFDDAWLKDARIGLQMVAKEGVTTPVAMALSRRGLNQHLVPFALWADAGDPAPQGKIVDAVADGAIDVALVWGPFAGYFAKKHGAILRIDPVVADPQAPDLVFVFPMAIGVRKADTDLRDRLQAALDHRKSEIAAILKDYDIPTMPISGAIAPLTH
jgi:quinoprotein dehydrogenase-associated probable ABC transporter substrate-binding protein